MKDYTEDNPPWITPDEWKDVTEVIVIDGVTTIGNSAFGKSSASIESVSLPDSITCIGTQ